MRLVSAKEAQLNLEANLPNSVKEILGLPTTPLAELKEEMMKPSEDTSDLITAARATSKKKRLGVTPMAHRMPSLRPYTSNMPPTATSPVRHPT